MTLGFHAGCQSLQLDSQMIGSQFSFGLLPPPRGSGWCTGFEVASPRGVSLCPFFVLLNFLPLFGVVLVGLQPNDVQPFGSHLVVLGTEMIAQFENISIGAVEIIRSVVAAVAMLSSIR